MFRPATIKEAECLLRAQGKEPIRLPRGVQSVDESNKVYKKSLSDAVRECMLAKASKYLLWELRSQKNRDVLKDGTGLTFECSCLSEGASCVLCQEVCTKFSEGVLTVLERDFVQLTHGRGAHLLEDQQGVQFLLAGITLGLLYESVPESSGLNELVLQVLIIMHDHKGWEHALELYGPAPPREYAAQPHRINTTGGRGHQKSKSTTLSGRWGPVSPEDTPRSISVAEGPPEFRTSLNQRKTAHIKAVVIDPTLCVECSVPFGNSGMTQECDCGTVTVRYPELYELKHEPSVIEFSTPKPRSRAKTI